MIELKLFSIFKKKKKPEILSREEFINETFKNLPEDQKTISNYSIIQKYSNSWALFLDDEE